MDEDFEPDDDAIETRRRHNREMALLDAEIEEAKRQAGEPEPRRFDIAAAPAMERVTTSQLSRLEAAARTEADRAYLVAKWDQVFGN